MTESWLDVDVSLVAADAPFHAGLALRALRGNLDRILNESGYRYQSMPHGTTTYAVHDFTDADLFEDLTSEWGGWRVPLRRVEGGGGFRQLRVVLSGRVTDTAAAATVRVYALPELLDSLDPDDTDGLVGYDCYDECIFSSTSYVAEELVIDVSEAALSADSATATDSTPDTAYHEVVLMAIAMIDDEHYDLRLRAPQVEEIP